MRGTPGRGWRRKQRRCNEEEGSIDGRTEGRFGRGVAVAATHNNTTLHKQRINSLDIIDQSGFVSGKQVIQSMHMLVPCPPNTPHPPPHPHTAPLLPMPHCRWARQGVPCARICAGARQPRGLTKHRLGAFVELVPFPDGEVPPLPQLRPTHRTPAERIPDHLRE